MSVLAVIPARYASTRFPGKPLALLGGRSIISRVWEQVSEMACVDEAIVATDDERIYSHINELAGREAAMMTSSAHPSGTDRCGEVLRRLEGLGEHYDVVVNIQGDEPFVSKQQIELLVESFRDRFIEIATLRTPIRSREELFSPNNVKVVCNKLGRALYFSRQPIPYRRGVDETEWLEGGEYYKHVGVYAFRGEALKEVCRLEPSMLEQCEKLEQLRWLEAGFQIAVKTTDHANIGIDTPEDLAEAEKALRKKDETLNVQWKV